MFSLQKCLSFRWLFIFYKNCWDTELGYLIRCSRNLVLPSCKGNLSARTFCPINAGSSNLWWRNIWIKHSVWWVLYDNNNSNYENNLKLIAKIIIVAIVIIIMGNSCFIIFIAYKGLHGEKCPIYNDAELTMKEMIDMCVWKS